MSARQHPQTLYALNVDRLHPGKTGVLLARLHVLSEVLDRHAGNPDLKGLRWNVHMLHEAIKTIAQNPTVPVEVQAWTIMLGVSQLIRQLDAISDDVLLAGVKARVLDIHRVRTDLFWFNGLGQAVAS